MKLIASKCHYCRSACFCSNRSRWQHYDRRFAYIHRNGFMRRVVVYDKHVCPAEPIAIERKKVASMVRGLADLVEAGGMR